MKKVMDQANSAQSMQNISVFLFFSLYFLFFGQYNFFGVLKIPGGKATAEVVYH